MPVIAPNSSTYTEFNVDNINIDGNTIISTDSNGNINITPNGSGRTVITAMSATSLRVITALNDTNGNEWLKITATGSAVDELTIANAATVADATTGAGPSIAATGDDTNIP